MKNAGGSDSFPGAEPVGESRRDSMTTGVDREGTK